LWSDQGGKEVETVETILVNVRTERNDTDDRPASLSGVRALAPPVHLNDPPAPTPSTPKKSMIFRITQRPLAR
jgi:hypothetical protein